MCLSMFLVRMISRPSLCSRSPFFSLPLFPSARAPSLGGMLGFTIMMATDLQNRMNAVERVLEYSTKIPQEPPWRVPEVDDALPAGMRSEYEDTLA